MTLIEKLMAERAALIAQAGSMLNAARDAGREMNAEENARFDKMHADASAIYGKIEEAKKAQARIDSQASLEASMRETAGRRSVSTQPGQSNSGQPQVMWKGKPLKIREGTAEAKRCTVEYNEAFSAFLGGAEGGPLAALETDVGGKGGYLAPPQFVAELIAEVANMFWMRQLARVLAPTTAPSVKWPKRMARSQTFQWGTELSTATADTSYALGTYELAPSPMVGEFEVSNDLMAASTVSVENIVREESVWGSGDLEEQAFMTGDGVRKPIGVFTPSAEGVPTSRDTTGAITTYDTFVNAKYSLREPFLRSPSLRWVFSRNSVRDLSKLKATTGEPLWVVSLRDGEPDRFLNVPTVLSEYAPIGSDTANAWKAGDYFGIIGDFSGYDIQDGLDMGLQRLMDSYYSRRNMTGFISRRKVDGKVRFANGFARVKVA